MNQSAIRERIRSPALQARPDLAGEIRRHDADEKPMKHARNHVAMTFVKLSSTRLSAGRVLLAMERRGTAQPYKLVVTPTMVSN